MNPPVPTPAASAQPRGADTPPTPGDVNTPALFQPTRLARRSLDVQVTPGMRQLGAQDREEIVERQQRILGRFDLTGPRRLRRLKAYLLGSVLLLPVLNAVLTSIGFRGYVWQVLLAAVYGTVLGLWRLGPPFSALWTCAVGLATVKIVNGSSLLSLSFGSMMALAFYAAVGFAIGLSDDLTRDED